MKKAVFEINKYVFPITEIEMLEITGGDSWINFWKNVGSFVGGLLPCYDNYDHEAELEALSNYGAPY